MSLIESSFQRAFRLHVRALMIEADVSPGQVAEALHLSRNTMYSRLNGTSRFTLDEVQLVADRLGVEVLDLWPVTAFSEAS